ncbi:tetratricopeptide repeat protein [Paracoccus liaowanqingii]|uniref:Tetratricopeptide repeat protein n=1 Tax=Paracoccus liaowanqingii TaxID=2560053 RepID=A0A4Z1CI07_9RHOB|nr:tetratricopeptide repeat protein [Paracoccus liaowanqingii]TGN62051.1 tetratricopeptide repeat protein [Paracoccus liaowanqingii]
MLPVEHSCEDILRAILLFLIFISLGVPAIAQSAEEFAARARQLASQGRPDDAARLFRRAIEISPRKRDDWLSEYADQLAFSGAANAAVPLYREVMNDPLQPEEKRESARRRLALALFWSWDLEEAVPALRGVAEDYPDDVDLREALNRATTALADVEAGAKRLAGFEMLWKGDYLAAVPALRQLVEERPADAELRSGFADALAGAARVRAEEKDFKQAVALFDEAAQVDPACADQFARQEAEFLLYGGLWNDAETRFRELLERPELSEEDRRGTLLGLARTYAWSGRPDEAVSIYDTLLAKDPDFASGLVGRGQVLADLGNYRRSREDFLRVLSVEPENADAIRGRARTTLGLQRPRETLVQLAPLLEEQDPAARLLAARAFHSMGRPDLAADLARTVVAQGEAVEEGTTFLETIWLEQTPLITLDIAHAWQSDGLRITTLRGRQTTMFEDGLTSFSLETALIRYRGNNFPDVNQASLRFSGSRRFNDAFESRGTLFLNIQDSREGRSRSTTFDTEIGFNQNDIWRYGLHLSRRYAGDTSRAIVERIFANDFGISARFSSSPEMRAAGRMMWSSLSDGNRRLSFEANASQQVLAGDHQVWLGAELRGFTYDRTSDFYWSPSSNANVLGTMQAFGPLPRGWRYGLNGSLGYSRSAPDNQGVTYGIRGQISREISKKGSVALSISHTTSLARTGEAGEGFGTLKSAWNRSEIGVVLQLRF